MTETTNLTEFIDKFDIVDNALQMRNLRRWNGRDLRDEENLAEHTHLVVCCVYKLYDELQYYLPLFYSVDLAKDLSKVVRFALLHDSLELFRGDILSITKDSIPGLRFFTDNEEDTFISSITKDTLSDLGKDLLKLADTMACYKFIEWELRYPSNEFAKEAYIKTKNVFDNLYSEFCEKYSTIKSSKTETITQTYKPFVKGYAADAGVDILLNEDVIFLPMSTTTVNLKVHITPEEGTMSFLCARTSAANKGLSVATCPIDANYTGEVLAIVHNTSNNIIKYKAGESFCQYVTCKINLADVPCKKEGKRSTSNLGGTDVNSN